MTFVLADADTPAAIRLATPWSCTRRRRLMRRHLELTADQVADLRHLHGLDVAALTGNTDYPAQAAARRMGATT